MRNRVPIITSCLIGAGLLAAGIFVSFEQKTLAQSPVDPAYTAHSAHVAADANQAGRQTVEAQLAEILARIEQLEANFQQQSGQSSPSGAMPMGAGNPPRNNQMPAMGSGAKPMQGGMAGMGRGPALADQMAELRGKMQRLEMTMQQQSGSSSSVMPMGGASGMGLGTKPMQGKMSGMSGMGAPGATKPSGGMSGMGGGASSPGGEMGMMAMKMDKMMGMMDKMMGGMGGGAKPAAAPMGGAAPGGGMGMMDMDDKMEMGGMGGGAMPAGAAPARGMSGGGGMGMMDMDKMEMAGMMGMMGGMGGKGGSSKAMSSALPGFPGASHLYHLGATGFFLDHPQHIALSTEQKMMLNQIKEQAALDKASADRSVQEAEQDLWTLTAADEPDNAQIEAKVVEIEKLKGDVRLRFISAVGDAAKILNEGQRLSLTGLAPPVSAAPAAPAMAAMKDM